MGPPVMTLRQAKARQMTTERERRALAVSNIEIRNAASEGMARVEGYAAVFNEWTDIGGMWREQVAPGAFAQSIRSDDIAFLVNHTGEPLDRRPAGTLSLREDDRGLAVAAEIDRGDPQGLSLIRKLERGLLDQMSMGITVGADEWSGLDTDMPERIIREVRLWEVSVVNFAAYKGTEISMRSLDLARQSAGAGRRARLRMRAALFDRDRASRR